MGCSKNKLVTFTFFLITAVAVIGDVGLKVTRDVFEEDQTASRISGICTRIKAMKYQGFCNKIEMIIPESSLIFNKKKIRILRSFHNIFFRLD